MNVLRSDGTRRDLGRVVTSQEGGRDPEGPRCKDRHNPINRVPNEVLSPQHYT